MTITPFRITDGGKVQKTEVWRPDQIEEVERAKAEQRRREQQDSQQCDADSIVHQR